MVVQGGWRNVWVSGEDSFGFGGVKFKGVISKTLVYGVDARGESVRGMSGGVGSVKVDLKVIGVSMKGNICVVGKYLEHGEEVKVKKERSKNITLGNTMGDRVGGDECELILTVEERLEM